MAETTIKVDMYGSVEEDGISLSLYFGDECEPATEENIQWDTIIQQHIETYCVPSLEFIPYESKEDLEEPFGLVRVLREVADDIENRLMSLQAFDRNAWLKSGKGDLSNDKTEFLKPMKEALND